MTPYRHDDGPGPQPESGVTSASVHASPRVLRKSVIAVACLAMAGTAFVIVDRVATGLAESRTAQAFQEGMGTPKCPSVDVRGFPVLTQLASGTLRKLAARLLKTAVEAAGETGDPRGPADVVGLAATGPARCRSAECLSALPDSSTAREPRPLRTSPSPCHRRPISGHAEKAQ